MFYPHNFNIKKAQRDFAALDGLTPYVNGKLANYLEKTITLGLITEEEKYNIMHTYINDPTANSIAKR